MAKQFTTKDARQLLQTHRELIALLESNSNYSDKQREDVASVATSLTAQNVFAHYVSRRLLSGNATTSLPDDIQQLIYSLFRYMKSLPFSKESKRVYLDTNKSIMQAMTDLRPGTSSLQWLFTSGENKERAKNAYTYLKEKGNSSYAIKIRSSNSDITQIDHQSEKSILEDFEHDKQSYRSALYASAPSVMQGGGSVQEIVQVCDKHQEFLERMDIAKDAIDKIREQIKSATDRMIASEVLKLLMEIPIEELGRERTGIRIKALRDFGYNTIADVFCATIYNLASVHGISESTAFAVMHYAKQYAEQAKAGVKIRLSVDDKRTESTKLVAAIYDYRRRTATMEELEEIKRLHCGLITLRLRDMREIGNGINWIFTEVSYYFQIIFTSKKRGDKIEAR